MTRIQPPFERTTETLAERFALVYDPVEGAATMAGFGGFKERAVADIGGTEEHCSELCLGLGAASLTCFETSVSSISRAWDSGRLRDVSIELGDVTKLSAEERFTGRFDVVTIYNITPHLTVQMVSAGIRMLKPKGDMIVTSAEVGLMSRVSEIEDALQQHFDTVQSARVWRGADSMPGNNMITLAIGKTENDA